jgi:hypothetical protein
MILHGRRRRRLGWWTFTLGRWASAICNSPLQKRQRAMAHDLNEYITSAGAACRMLHKVQAVTTDDFPPDCLLARMSQRWSFYRCAHTAL